MSLASKLIVAALAALAAVACSSTPKQTTAPAAKDALAASQAPPAATTATGATTSINGATQAAGGGATQINPKLVGQGYKPVKVKNVFVYCRMEAVTGTQFKKRVCLTEAAIHDLEQQTKETQESMSKQRTGPACFSKTC